MKKLLLLLFCFAVAVTSQAQLRNLFSKDKKSAVQDTAQVAPASSSQPQAENVKGKKEKKQKEEPQPKEKKVKEAKQKSPKVEVVREKKDWSKIDLSKRPADHFMVQTGFQSWVNTNDSISTSGLGRFFNFYGMYDKPSKANPHYSTAFGLGITTDNMYFGSSNVINIKGGSAVGFGSNGTNYYKKMKLATVYVEIPVELRYYSNPENPNKSWKFAVGLKGGILLKAYSKGKNYVDNTGGSLYGNSYVVKEKNNAYFNSFDGRGSFRVGYGIFSLYTDFQITPVFKTNYGPPVRNFTFGISISGL